MSEAAGVILPYATKARDLTSKEQQNQQTMRLNLLLLLVAFGLTCAGVDAQLGTPGNPMFLGIPAPAYIPGQENLGFSIKPQGNPPYDTRSVTATIKMSLLF